MFHQEFASIKSAHYFICFFYNLLLHCSTFLFYGTIWFLIHLEKAKISENTKNSTIRWSNRNCDAPFPIIPGFLKEMLKIHRFCTYIFIYIIGLRFFIEKNLLVLHYEIVGIFQQNPIHLRGNFWCSQLRCPFLKSIKKHVSSFKKQN